jgi:outer membrane protein with beta-barrel domain
MKNVTLIIFVLFLGYTTNAQVADSVLYELENDTVPVEKSKKLKDSIVVFGDEEASENEAAMDAEIALDAEEETDTIRMRIGNKKVIIIDDYSLGLGDDDDEDDDDDKFDGHWDGILLGLNSYVKPGFDTDLSPDANFMELNTNKSWQFGINFAEKSFNLIDNKVGLVTGLGISWNNYKFDQNITLNPDSSYISHYVDTVKDFSKNKLTASYLSVPLLLEFQIPTGHHSKPVHLNAGVVGAIKLGSHTKQVYEINNKEYKDKVKEDFHLSPLRYSVHASIGYGNFTIFSSYSMSTLFENGEGPELYPLTIGIIIGD